MDSDWAMGELETFIDLTKSKNASTANYITSQSVSLSPRDEVLRQWAKVKPILDRVHPQWQEQHGQSPSYEFRQQRDAAIHALSLLRAEAELAEHLNPLEPALTSSSLHPWVWEAARPLWGDGHFRAAVQQAGTAVDLRLQTTSGRRDITGQDLVRQLFSSDPAAPGKPRLRVPEQPGEETTRSLQQGARALGEACFGAVRNPVTHTTDDIPEAEALEQLAVLSYFCRIVQACSIEQVNE